MLLGEHFHLSPDHFVCQKGVALGFIEGVDVGQDFIEHEIDLTPYDGDYAQVV